MKVGFANAGKVYRISLMLEVHSGCKQRVGLGIFMRAWYARQLAIGWEESFEFCSLSLIAALLATVIT